VSIIRNIAILMKIRGFPFLLWWETSRRILFGRWV